MFPKFGSKVCLALDGMALHLALRLLYRLGRRCDIAKVHDQLDMHGPNVLSKLSLMGFVPWVDYKLHDTPDTIELRVAALAANGAKIITVHAAGGVEMMARAVKTAGDEVEIWAVALLTSLDEATIKRVYGAERTATEIAHELALMAKEAGIRTMVCSALDVKALSESPRLDRVRFVVPGTQTGTETFSHYRTSTPQQAVQNGANLIVAGSSVTQAPHPAEAFEALDSKLAALSSLS